MILLFCLHLSCSLHGLPGDECIAVAMVESGLTVDARNGAHLGPMQVRRDLTPWPEWTLTTAAGGAMAGAGALAYWHKHRPVHPWRGYACGWRDGSKRCAEYESKVLRALAGVRRARGDGKQA